MNFNQQKSLNPLRVYKRISLGFVVLTVFLLFLVMYMALSRATIIIEPKGEPIKADLSVTIRENKIAENDILGRFATTTTKVSSIFKASSEIIEIPAVAKGTVMVYNKSTNNQILISTTRFLSEDNILFRLKDRVMVPAGGNLLVEVYADKKGKAGNIAPTTFTIPGLSSVLQKKIYGESKEPMIGGVVASSTLSQADIDSATLELSKTAISQVKDYLEEILTIDKNLKGVIYTSQVLSQDPEIEVNTKEPGTFKLSLEFGITGISYSKELIEEAEKALNSAVPANRKIISSNLDNLNPIVESLDINNHIATVKVPLSGKIFINAKSPILEKSNFTGKSEEEVREYLKKYASIESVEFKFFPFWLGKVPSLRDHIKIIVK